VISEKDIEYEELGPGKGARLTLSGETAAEVIAVCEKRGIAPPDMLLACIEAFVQNPSFRDEVIRHLEEESHGSETKAEKGIEP